MTQQTKYSLRYAYRQSESESIFPSLKGLAKKKTPKYNIPPDIQKLGSYEKDYLSRMKKIRENVFVEQRKKGHLSLKSQKIKTQPIDEKYENQIIEFTKYMKNNQSVYHLSPKFITNRAHSNLQQYNHEKIRKKSHRRKTINTERLENSDKITYERQLNSKYRIKLIIKKEDQKLLANNRLQKKYQEGSLPTISQHENEIRTSIMKKEKEPEIKDRRKLIKDWINQNKMKKQQKKRRNEEFKIEGWQSAELGENSNF